MGGCTSMHPNDAGPPRHKAKRSRYTEEDGQAPAWTKHFQIIRGSGSSWEDFPPKEGVFITQAFLVGQPHCDFTFKGVRYHYDFEKMIQVNRDTKEICQIRPHPDIKHPFKPLLPPGPMLVVTVRKGEPGTTMTMADPNNPGQNLFVVVPSTAKPGSKLAVPCCNKGETFEQVVNRQAKYPTEAQPKVKNMVTTGLNALLGIVLDEYSGDSFSIQDRSGFDGIGAGTADRTHDKREENQEDWLSNASDDEPEDRGENMIMVSLGETGVVGRKPTDEVEPPPPPKEHHVL